MRKNESPYLLLTFYHACLRIRCGVLSSCSVVLLSCNLHIEWSHVTGGLHVVNVAELVEDDVLSVTSQVTIGGFVWSICNLGFFISTGGLVNAETWGGVGGNSVTIFFMWSTKLSKLDWGLFVGLGSQLVLGDCFLLLFAVLIINNHGSTNDSWSIYGLITLHTAHF